MGNFYTKHFLKDFIITHGLPYAEGDEVVGRGVYADLENAIGAEVHEDDPKNNIRLAVGWLDQHQIDGVNYLQDPNLHREPIDLALERSILSSNNLTRRTELLKRYGEVMYHERLAAWGCTPGSNKPGTEPGKATDEIIKKAEKIVASESANSPFNPRRVFKNDAERQRDIANFIRSFGSKAAQVEAAKFGTDIAGRALRQRA